MPSIDRNAALINSEPNCLAMTVLTHIPNDGSTAETRDVQLIILLITFASCIRWFLLS
jgi:hypothetical protein